VGRTKLKQSKTGAMERRRERRSAFPSVTLHPLFILTGIWYSLTGELFTFLSSCLVALQHECAHAFAAARLGYSLNRIVLMPYGAVIDGDLQGLRFKDEAFVAVCGPLCNLCTAAFFVAVWWFFPDAYAYTDTAFYASVAIALCNLLPAYPLDGGRILHAALCRLYLKKDPRGVCAQAKAKRVCRIVSMVVAGLLLTAFALTLRSAVNFSLLAFGVFLAFGAFGNKNKDTVYEKLDLSFKTDFKKGVEVRRVAIRGDMPIKDILPFISRDGYLVLEVYNLSGERVFEISQNEFSELFLQAETPYMSVFSLKTAQKR